MSSKSSIETVKLGVILALFAAVSCTILAVVNNFTSSVIEKNKIEKANAAMKVVMSEATSFEAVKEFEASTDSTISIQSFYVAKKDGKEIGAVVQVNGPTYDRGTLMVGMLKDGTVTGVQFLELSDSPGFGIKAKDPSFKLPNGKTFCGQFEGKNAKDGFIPGQTFDAITGSTITSRGTGNLLTQATGSMLKYFGGAN